MKPSEQGVFVISCGKGSTSSPQLDVTADYTGQKKSHTELPVIPMYKTLQ